jgi:YcxB-like protein
MSDPIEFTTQLSEGDLLAFLRAHGRKSMRLMNGFVLLLAASLATNAVLNPAGDGTLASRILSFLTPAALLVAVFWLIPLSLKNNARKQLTSSRTLGARTHYLFDEDGMTAETPESSGRLSWTAINRVLETDTGFAVYTSNMCANVIPKRDLPVKTIEQIRELLTSKGLLKKTSRT